MLTLYRRHQKSCEHREEGRRYRRCKCPLWVQGWLGKQYVRKSLGISDWGKAQSLIREWEASNMIRQPAKEPTTLEEACDEFERDAIARGLREPTVYKYRLLFRRLRSFAKHRGFRYLIDFDLSSLPDFRATWPNTNLAAIKKLEALKTFLKFAYDSGWISEDPAKKLKNPQIVQCPTLPFERDEMQRTVAACDRYAQCGKDDSIYGQRLGALVLVLRYSGLRIGDAVTLSRERVKGGKVLLYTSKTGTPVYCPLPEIAVEALEELPVDSPYYFWTGQSKRKSAAGDWQRSLAKLFKLAGVENGHAHRFRDTYAVENLLAGVTLEQVSVLLGHQSLRVREKHYAPWVRARQRQLEASVRTAWAVDPIVTLKTKGTREVRRKSSSCNNKKQKHL